MGNIYTNFDFSKLEFNIILNEISNYTLSEKGKESLLNSIPEKNTDRVIYLHNILNQLKNYFFCEENLKLNIIYNFGKQLEDAVKNIVLTEIELYQFAFSVRLYFIRDFLTSSIFLEIIFCSSNIFNLSPKTLVETFSSESKNSL